MRAAPARGFAAWPLAAIYVASGLKELVVFVLFLALLLFRPAGLLGKSRA